MNKMDEFFKKQLTNHQGADDGWNIPSEDIWNKAQPHFPKPKKKRRFIFFLLPLILICGIGSYTVLKDASNHLEIVTIDNDIQSVSNTGDHKATQPIELSSNKTINHVPQETVIKENKTIPIKSKKLTPPNIQKHVTQQAEQERSIAVIKRTPNNQSNQSTNLPVLAFANQQITPPTLRPTAVFAEEEEKKQVTTKGYSLNQVKQLEQLSSFVESSNSNPTKIQTLVGQLVLANTDNKRPILSRHEIGIGSTLHLLTMLGEVKSDPNEEWPLEEIYLTSEKNINLNLHYNYLLSPKWSLSTGLYLNNLNLNISGLTFYNFTQADIEGEVLTNLDDKIDGNFTSFRQTDAYQIELTQGETIQAGETIGIDLDVSVNYKSAHLPVIINRSWRMKNSEIFVGLGGSINLQSWQQQSAEIELYRGNTLITKPYSEGELTPETIASLGLVFQTGFNYNITKRLKLGVAGRIFIPEFMPSGLEARLLYSL